MRLEISGRAIVGSKEPQQDSWRVFNARGENLGSTAKSNVVVTGDGTLVVVADGIGGYAGGEVASRVACDAFGRAFFSKEGAVADRLTYALEVANQAIADEKRSNSDLRDMGCTLIGVHFHQDKMTFVSVGDSLLLRSRDNEIHRVNVDHSYFDYLDRQVLGSDDPERWSVAVRDTRRRASLTLAVTGGDLAAREFGHEPQIAVRPLLIDDVILVASDGIETLDLVQLQNFMQQLRPTGTAGIADGLIRAVDGIGKTRSYQDNTTIVVVGASEGAGLTRVSLAPPVLAARAAVESASPLSPLPVLSNRMLWTGAAVVGAVLFVLVLVLLAGSFTGKKEVRPQQASSAPGTTENVPAQGGQLPQSKPPPTQPPDPGPGQQQPAPAAPVGAPDPPEKATTETRPAPVQPPTDERGSQPAVGQDGGKLELRTKLENIALQGEVLEKKTQTNTNSGACYLLCLADPACLAYAWHPDGRCEPFGSVSSQMSEMKARSGAKEWRHVAWQGISIASRKPVTAENSNACFVACLSSSECMAYTWHRDRRCELFSSIEKEQKTETDAWSGAKEMR
jgi:serine/threonine protein phosphatase PrpC